MCVCHNVAQMIYLSINVKDIKSSFSITIKSQTWKIFVIYSKGALDSNFVLDDQREITTW